MNFRDYLIPTEGDLIVVSCPKPSENFTHPKKLTRFNSTPFDPTTSAVDRGSSPLKIDSGGLVLVSLPPKPEKLELSDKNPDSDKNF